MRIFINNVNSYVGKALCADLRSVLDQDNRLLGTVVDENAEVDSNLMDALGVKRIVSRADPQKYLSDVLSCSLIIYDLHSASIEEVERVVKHLKLAQLEHETVFVLISSVNTWARTRKEMVDVEPEEGEEVPEDDGEEAREVKKRPNQLTDLDCDRRIPSPGFEAWKYLETLALSLGPKEKLRPHVICSGILYGNGETTFNEMFKAAWLTQPVHVILAPGDNYIPCVHVRDVSRLVKVVAADSKIEPYLIAVDNAWLTQAQIVNGIVNQISKKREVPLCNADDVQMEYKDVMMLDLIMKPSAPMQARSFPWWSKGGLVQNIEKVAEEFCKWRNLRPIKMVVTGPPGAGMETYCRMVADRYLHEDPPHLTFDQIVDEAMQAGTESAARLARKVAKVRQIPGAELPLKQRIRLVKARLLSNVCRYRGYVLEGFPSTYEESEALFTELDLTEEEAAALAEEEAAAEEAEEEEEEEPPPPPPPADEDEEEEEGRPKRKLNAAVIPEFVLAGSSSEEMCKARIFSGLARGVSGTQDAAREEQEFYLKSAAYRKANLAEDGSPGTSEFFSEVAGIKVLQVDVDRSCQEDVFQAIHVYLESRGRFFNYLPTEVEMVLRQEAEVARLEREEDERRTKAEEEQRAAEAALRRKVGEEESQRRQVISENEASLLESEAMPLRQYLMVNVVPTLSQGLSEVCKEQPEDPIEYLAQYLFAHAADISAALDEQQQTR